MHYARLLASKFIAARSSTSIRATIIIVSVSHSFFLMKRFELRIKNIFLSEKCAKL